MAEAATNLEAVPSGSSESEVIAEELALFYQVQKELARDQLSDAASDGYDQDLLSLRDQISEARAEDLAPLVAEMYRMQALGQANGKGRTLPVDVKCPYFGHLKLNNGRKTRDVLIGNRAFVKPGSPVAIVDWRNAPVSRVYYCYDEGDDYEEQFGGRIIAGTVVARRTVSIIDGQLRRISWSDGAVVRRGDGVWVRIPPAERPMLKGGAGAATRPPSAHEAPAVFKPKRLGVVGDESLREDKHLREITALIDPVQFRMITQPESGIVILQGGAGSGKTTVALHRAAYLHFQDPRTFSPKKMLIVVKSEPLTEYISRVLPSLDVHGTSVVTLENWMRQARQKVLPEEKRSYVTEVPAAVARLKKHPVMLDLLEEGVREEAAAVRAGLSSKASPEAAGALEARWDQLSHLALLPRIREMTRWLEAGPGQRLGLSSKQMGALVGILRRAKTAGADVVASWSHLLTDRTQLTAAIQARKLTDVSPSEIEELIRWVSLQDEERSVDDDGEETEDEGQESRLARSEAEGALDQRIVGGNGSDNYGIENEPDRPMPVDGAAHDDEDEPKGCFDEHDDALLLKLTQLKFGGLPVAGSDKTLTYEHVVVDEAQDLCPTDVAVLRGTLTSRDSMTLAGDTAQKLIFDNSFENWETMLEDVGVSGVKIDQLRISYRSTRQIVDFSRYVLGPLADDVEPVVPRTGAPVEQFLFSSSGEAMAFLSESLRSLVTRERKANVAVVTRYRAHADMYYEGLRKAEVPGVRRVYGKEFSFQAGVDVVDVTQIKGLEYDYVILTEVNGNVYPETREARHLLHIASTRAVHQLWVTSVGEPSPLLPPSEI
jgi:DNA helicase II / ATP-dependent DNA helicase PcrA